jgi:glycosyltransferase involved in cell wall biosynthesis
MYRNPDYLFFKQCSVLRSYFGEICLDVPRPGMSAIVYSEMREAPIGSVRFVTGPKYDRSTFRARMISWIKYLFAAAAFCFSVSGRPLIFLIAQPPIIPVLGYLQKKIYGRRYVVWIDDVYPDVLIRKKLISPRGWVARAWSHLNRVTLRNAEHIFTLTPSMLTTLQRYLPDGFPMTIIPTWVDTDLILPVPKCDNSWAEQNGLTEKTVIMYSGNFGNTHDLDSLLEAARLLKARPDLIFVLIGAGTKWEAVRRSVCEKNDTNVLVLPWQPSSVLHQSLSSADIAYVSLGTGIEGISMPSKTYYAMAAGSAVLASSAEISDLAKIVNRFDCGIVVKPGCVPALVEAIERLCSDRAMLEKCKNNARTAAVEHYSRSVNGKILREILEDILQGEAAHGQRDAIC